MHNFDLQSLVRPNIWALKPYSSARDEFTGIKGVTRDDDLPVESDYLSVLFARR